MLVVMNRSRLRQLFGLMLGLCLALGTTTSAVRATDMAVRMAMTSDAGAMDHLDCDGCGDGQGMKSTGCGMVCVAPVLAALPQTFAVLRVDTRELPLPTQRFLVGRAFSPDPHPPRSTDLG